MPDSRPSVPAGLWRSPAALKASCGLSSEFFDSPPQLRQRALRIADFTLAGRGEAEISFGPPASLRRRVAHCRRRESFLLQPLERGVDAAEDHVPSAALFD